MEPSIVLAMARFLRLGTFPWQPTEADWKKFPSVPPSAWQGTLVAAQQIAEAGTLPSDMLPFEKVSDYYGGDAGGPLGSQSATADMDIKISKPGMPPFHRHVRVKVPWDASVESLSDEIQALIAEWLKKYGGLEVEIHPQSFYIH